MNGLQTIENGYIICDNKKNFIDIRGLVANIQNAMESEGWLVLRDSLFALLGYEIDLQDFDIDYRKDNTAESWENEQLHHSDIAPQGYTNITDCVIF